MAEFLQSYGIWIFLGLMVLVMLRGLGRGMGCGMGGCQHDHADNQETKTDNDKTNDSHRSSGCH